MAVGAVTAIGQILVVGVHKAVFARRVISGRGRHSACREDQEHHANRPERRKSDEWFHPAALSFAVGVTDVHNLVMGTVLQRVASGLELCSVGRAVSHQAAAMGSSHVGHSPTCKGSSDGPFWRQASRETNQTVQRPLRGSKFSTEGN